MRGIGQELTVVGWELGIREGSDNAQRVEAAATRLRERVTASQDAVRRLAVNLRRRRVDQNIAPSETHAHIEWFRKQTGIRTGLGGEQLLSTLSPEGANCAFRIIQEALTNVAKHAYAHSRKSKSAKRRMTGFKSPSPTMDVGCPMRIAPRPLRLD
jgi:signal transduction histidine kinase